MLNVLLNIIGILCIIISLIYINRNLKKEKNIHEEIKSIYDNIRDYSLFIENVLNSFDELINNSLNKIDNHQKTPNSSINTKEIKKNIIEDEVNKRIKRQLLNNEGGIEKKVKDIDEKIVELKNIGLSNKEIAKKLNKGIREVEIILKMRGNE